MNATKEFVKQTYRVGVMQDALLGGFMVKAIKQENPEEYAKLLEYFMSKEYFVVAMDQMIDSIGSELLWDIVEGKKV